jgi:hypothetical protein
MADTEGGRISRLVRAAATCDAAQALAKARAARGGGSCVSCKGGRRSLAAEPITESALLEKRMRAAVECGIPASEGCVTSSLRTTRVGACVIANGTPFNRFIPPPCPPAIYRTVVVDEAGNVTGIPALGPNISGNPAVLQGRVCPLPNKPDNPVLPG